MFGAVVTRTGPMDPLLRIQSLRSGRLSYTKDILQRLRALFVTSNNPQYLVESYPICSLHIAKS